MTQIILIRHGETLWNLERRMQGQSDSPLSPTGEKQVRLLARRLSRMAFNELYSSDSGRAQQTARCIAEVTGHPIHLEPRLRERHFGVFEGMTADEISAIYPEAYLRFKSRDPDYEMPGGESARLFRARVLECLHDIASSHARRMVVIVTHGLVLDLVYRTAKGMALDEKRNFKLVNAGINRLRYAEGKWHVDVWADGSHLAEGLLTTG